MKIPANYDYEEVIERINNLDKAAKECYIQKGNSVELTYEVLYVMALVDKSIKLIDTFLYALEKKNITILAILTRVQMDCVFRTYALLLVENRASFAKEVLIEKKQINRLNSADGEKMRDAYLAKKVEEWLKLPVCDLYNKVCGFVHFSDKSFYSMISLHEQYKFEMLSLSRENPPEQGEMFDRLSLELANQFLFFGDILINSLLDSWVNQCLNINESAE